MATKYFNDSDAGDGDYNNNSNWFLGAGETGGGTTRGGASDDVIFETNCSTNGGAAASVNTLVVNGSVAFAIEITTAAGATFNDSSSNDGTVNGGAVFNDSSYNGYSGAGIVNGGAVFNDTSQNLYYVNDGAVFNDGAWNYGGNVYGGAVFNDLSSSSNNGAIIDTSAVFSEGAAVETLKHACAGGQDIVSIDIQRGINGSSILGVC